jgi:hypothetical protein
MNSREIILQAEAYGLTTRATDLTSKASHPRINWAYLAGYDFMSQT